MKKYAILILMITLLHCSEDSGVGVDQTTLTEDSTEQITDPVIGEKKDDSSNSSKEEVTEQPANDTNWVIEKDTTIEKIEKEEKPDTTITVVNDSLEYDDTTTTETPDLDTISEEKEDSVITEVSIKLGKVSIYTSYQTLDPNTHFTRYWLDVYTNGYNSPRDSIIEANYISPDKYWIDNFTDELYLGKLTIDDTTYSQPHQFIDEIFGCNDTLTYSITTNTDNLNIYIRNDSLFCEDILALDDGNISITADTDNGDYYEGTFTIINDFLAD